QWLRIYSSQKLHRVVLEKVDQAVVTGCACVILCRRKRDLTKPHEPGTHAQAVVPKRDAQVIGPRVVPSLIVVKVLPGGWSDRSRRVRRGAPAPKNERARGPLAFTSHHQQTVRKRFEGYLPVLSPRVREPKIRRVQ